MTDAQKIVLFKKRRDAFAWRQSQLEFHLKELYLHAKKILERKDRAMLLKQYYDREILTLNLKTKGEHHD